MNKVKLEDLCTTATSNISQKNIIERTGTYPIFGAAGLIRHVDFFTQTKDYLGVVKDGAGIGRVLRLPKESSVIGTIQYLIPNDNIDVNFLFHAVSSMRLEKYHSGATIPHIYFKDYKHELIPFYTEEKQREIASVLDRLCICIAKKEEQLQKFDQLAKSRFIEMFGDPTVATGTLVCPMTDICEIIDGDRGKNYPTQEEFSESGFCLFLNAKNVTAKGFQFKNCMFITEQKDSSLRKGKLQRGDIVLTTRGTLGNIAFYDKSVPYENIRINSGMVILRMNHSLISEIFFIEQFRMQLTAIKQKVASGSAQPQLPINTMNQIRMIVPPLSLQNEFAAFIEELDKSKVTIRKSLETLKTTYRALLQEYFG